MDQKTEPCIFKHGDSVRQHFVVKDTASKAYLYQAPKCTVNSMTPTVNFTFVKLWRGMPVYLLMFAMMFRCSASMPIPMTTALIKETMNRIQLSDLHGKLVPVDLVLFFVLIYFGRRLREHTKKVIWEKKYRKRPFLDPTEHQCVYYTYPVPGPDPANSFPASRATSGCRTSGHKCTIQEIPVDSMHEYEHLPSLP